MPLTEIDGPPPTPSPNPTPKNTKKTSACARRSGERVRWGEGGRLSEGAEKKKLAWTSYQREKSSDISGRFRLKHTFRRGGGGGGEGGRSQWGAKVLLEGCGEIYWNVARGHGRERRGLRL